MEVNAGSAPVSPCREMPSAGGKGRWFVGPSNNAKGRKRMQPETHEHYGVGRYIQENVVVVDESDRPVAGEYPCRQRSVRVASASPVAAGSVRRGPGAQ